MTTGHPCPPGEYTIWISRDGEHYVPTWTTNMDVAIRQAINEDMGREIPPAGQGEGWQYGFYLAWARYNHVRLDHHFVAGDWIDRVAEQMDEEDGPDENGENHPLEDLRAHEIMALEASVRSAIWHWQNRRGLALRSYWLDMKSPPEWVQVTEQYATQQETAS